MLYFVYAGACKRGCEKRGEGAVGGVTRWGVDKFLYLALTQMLPST